MTSKKRTCSVKRGHLVTVHYALALLSLTSIFSPLTATTWIRHSLSILQHPWISNLPQSSIVHSCISNCLAEILSWKFC